MRKLVTATLSSASLFALCLVAPAVSQAAPCDGVGSEQPFTEWHDQASYVLVSGGDFESAVADWTLAGGAGVVAGGNSLRPGSSANSLNLPSGASATTPPICVGKGNPVARIFMRSAASGARGAGGLKVQVLYLDAEGGVRKVKKAGSLRGNGEWAPSRRFGLAQGQFGQAAKPGDPTKPGNGNGPPESPPGQDNPHGPSNPTHRGSIQLRFTAGAGSVWQIDDVFVDPRARY